MPAVRRLEQLLDDVVAGDETAWHALVDAFAGLVWSVPRGSGLDPTTSADVAQTAWLRLVERLGTLAANALPGAVADEARRETVRALRWVLHVPDEPGPVVPLAAALAALPARTRYALRVAAAGAGPGALAGALALDEPEAVALLDAGLARLRADRPDLEDLADDAVLARLDVALADPPPPAVLAAARAAYSWRTLDAELLPAPREAPDDAGLSLRSAEGSRLETFRGPGVVVELEVEVTAGERALVGRVEPGHAVVTLLRPDGSARPLPLDGLGRLLVDGLEPGPVCLRVETGGRAVRTGWLVL